jgi:2-oxoglutarate dehydrogenase E2 component (dihydrolipoamide succinyltransferase)
VLEVPAPSAGVITEIVVADGGTVVSDQVIAKIDTEAAGCRRPAPAAAAAAPAPAAAAVAAPAATGGSKSDVAMPAAAKLMADNGLAAGSVAGTGKDGRVTKGDVLAAVAGGAKPAAPRPAARPPPSPSRCRRGRAVRPEPGRPSGAARADDAPARPHRRAPAAVAVHQRHPDHLQRSQHGPGDGDAQEVPGQVREGTRRQAGLHELLRQGGRARLKKYPILNASVDGNDIVYHGYFDIGIAVGSPRGLVVPILRNADQMSFADIEKKIADSARRPRTASWVWKS